MGSYLMCFRFLQVMRAFVRTGDLPHHDHAHVDGLNEADHTFDAYVEPEAAK
jgi:C4-dicarboxylate transporter DctQ subunit